jgi:hypothetical protein
MRSRCARGGGEEAAGLVALVPVRGAPAQRRGGADSDRAGVRRAVPRRSAQAGSGGWRLHATHRRPPKRGHTRGGRAASYNKRAGGGADGFPARLSCLPFPLPFPFPAGFGSRVRRGGRPVSFGRPLACSRCLCPRAPRGLTVLPLGVYTAAQHGRVTSCWRLPPVCTVRPWNVGAGISFAGSPQQLGEAVSRHL